MDKSIRELASDFIENSKFPEFVSDIESLSSKAERISLILDLLVIVYLKGKNDGLYEKNS